jgi:hypothetical protein
MSCEAYEDGPIMSEIPRYQHLSDKLLLVQPHDPGFDHYVSGGEWMKPADVEVHLAALTRERDELRNAIKALEPFIQEDEEANGALWTEEYRAVIDELRDALGTAATVKQP